MSSLNIFQKFLEDEELRSKMELNLTIGAILDYCEYATRIEFNQSQKGKYKSKNRKKQLSKEFTEAFTSLNREQKVQYYCRVVGYLNNFAKGIFDPPTSPRSGIINDIGFSRSFNVKRWKDKKLRLDQDRHILYAERETKIKNYDMKNYILRKSKNKDYFSFVLQAINSNPPEKSRTVHIGFTDINKFQIWYNSIKFSVQFREWQMFHTLYRSKSSFSKTFSQKMHTTDDLTYNKSAISDVKYMSEPRSSDVDENQFMSTSMVIYSNKRQEIEEDGGRKLVEGEREKLPKREHDKELLEKEKLEEEIKRFQMKREGGPKTLVGQLIEEDVFEQPETFQEKIEEEGQVSRMGKKHLDLFHKLCPEYELQEVEIFANYDLLHEQPNFKIFQHSQLQKRLKMVISFSKQKHSKQQILSMIAKPQTASSLNQNLQQIQVKTYIPSQNSALMYLILKPYNRLYRSRDFVFIRHVFNEGKTLYMVDKSIQNINYPPFMTIVRGELCIVYAIFERENHFQLIADVKVANQGYLNAVQETNLTVKYLKAWATLPTAEVETNSYKFFDLEWDISKNQINQIDREIRTRQKTIHKIQQQINKEEVKERMANDRVIKNFAKKNAYDETQVKKQEVNEPPLQHKFKKQIESPYSQKNGTSPVNYSSSSKSPSPQPKKKMEVKRFDKKSMQQFGQINLQDADKADKIKLKTDLSVVRQLNSEGFVIIDNSFRKHHYIMSPMKQTPRILQEPIAGHPIWRGEWIHDDKDGGMFFINKKKIEDQKGVLKFILTKIAKNIFSGQSIMSISLPVDIFAAESNIQRFLYSMLYAPILLEKLEKESLLVKFARTVGFGVSNSLLYLSIQKPFNPILGQTFQCWLNGCPAYAQQISHHPPIAGLFLKGRGYQVSAQLQSKVSLAVNSGTGTNDGIFKVKFNDGTEICFICPGGELSGLTHGDRKFNIVGKSYYWIQDKNLVLELAFDPYKKGLFSVGKQQEPSDYFQGCIYEVSPHFMTKFLAGKRKEPEQKDRVRNLGKISGYWNRCVKFNNEEIINFDTQYPLVLQYEAHPLPSDANWREDIEYRRRNETTRAQTEKQRMEVAQRKDKKIREKYNKKK